MHVISCLKMFYFLFSDIFTNAIILPPLADSFTRNSFIFVKYISDSNNQLDF